LNDPKSGFDILKKHYPDLNKPDEYLPTEEETNDLLETFNTILLKNYEFTENEQESIIKRNEVSQSMRRAEFLLQAKSKLILLILTNLYDTLKYSNINISATYYDTEKKMFSCYIILKLIINYLNKLNKPEVSETWAQYFVSDVTEAYESNIANIDFRTELKIPLSCGPGTIQRLYIYLALGLHLILNIECPNIENEDHRTYKLRFLYWFSEKWLKSTQTDYYKNEIIKDNYVQDLKGEENIEKQISWLDEYFKSNDWKETIKSIQGGGKKIKHKLKHFTTKQKSKRNRKTKRKRLRARK
jgi:hypothetical protein